MDSETTTTTNSASASSKKLRTTSETDGNSSSNQNGNDSKGKEDGEVEGGESLSVFDQKTENASATQYFHYYGQMMHQQVCTC